MKIKELFIFNKRASQILWQHLQLYEGLEVLCNELYLVLSHPDQQMLNPKPIDLVKLNQNRIVLWLECQWIIGLRILLHSKFRTTSDVTESHKTFFRILRGSRSLTQAPAKKLLISKKNQRACFRFAYEYVFWAEEQWSQLHFIDESKSNVIRSYGRCTSNEELVKGYRWQTVKYGGSSVILGEVTSAASPDNFFAYKALSRF